jgi:type IV secretion system protein VirB10
MNTINAASDNGVEQQDGKVDRDIPKLQVKKKKNSIRRLIITSAILLAVVLTAVGLAIFMQRLKDRSLQEKADKAKQQSAVRESEPTGLNLEAAKKRIKAEDAANHPPTDQMPPPSGAIAAVPAGGAPDASNFASAKMAGGAGGTGGPGQYGPGSGNQGSQPYGGQYQQKPMESPRQRRLAGDVLVSMGGEDQLGAHPGQGGERASVPAPGLPLRAEGSALEQATKATKLKSTAASRIRNLDLMMLAGTMIPCGQRTLIVSTNPGQVSCIVSKDVYSANGAALLIERGSEVTGERMQPLQLGQEMLPVTWSRIVTPRGVTIDIDSLATDTLGASGLPVYVDEHWRKRFGSAIMLSLISDLGQAVANKAADAEGTIRLTTTANAGQDLASRALDKTINIPPTGYSLQGEAINIFVARDVDFGRVYELARY